MPKQLIVYDLDESLVHSIQRGDLDADTISSLLVCLEARDKNIQEPIKVLPSVFGLNDTQPPTFTLLKSGDRINYRQFAFVTILRPYAVQLLAALYKEGDFDLAVFSMGTEDYVKACCFLLQQQVREFLGDQNMELFKAIKTRKDSKFNSSLNSDYKDLSSFNGYQAENVLLVDNLALNFSMNTRQGIPITAYSLDTIKRRECTQTGQLRCDIGLLRLHHYLKLLDPAKPLSQQNVFGVFS